MSSAIRREDSILFVVYILNVGLSSHHLQKRLVKTENLRAPLRTWRKNVNIFVRFCKVNLESRRVIAI